MKKQPAKQVSVTFQTSDDFKQKLEAEAIKRGFCRIVDGEERGNLSAILNVIIRDSIQGKPATV
jgi:hypothetical protein